MKPARPKQLIVNEILWSKDGRSAVYLWGDYADNTVRVQWLDTFREENVGLDVFGLVWIN